MEIIREVEGPCIILFRIFCVEREDGQLLSLMNKYHIKYKQEFPSWLSD